MTTIQFTVPEEALAALRRSPERFGADVRLAAAIHWYSRGEASQETAAAIAGLDRTDFILALSRAGVDAFRVDMDVLRRELESGRSR